MNLNHKISVDDAMTIAEKFNQKIEGRYEDLLYNHAESLEFIRKSLNMSLIDGSIILDPEKTFVQYQDQKLTLENYIKTICGIPIEIIEEVEIPPDIGNDDSSLPPEDGGW